MKKHLSTDARGNKRTDVGWEVSPAGKVRQHTFYLGQDEREAERRKARLHDLWSCVEARWKRLKAENKTT